MLKRPPRKIFDRYRQGHTWYAWDRDDPGTLTLTPIFKGNKIPKNAGHTYTCAHCRYTFFCLLRQYPIVCCHCRTTLPQSLRNYLPIDTYDRFIIEREYVYCQLEELRVSCACPLFREGLIVCNICREKEENKRWKVTENITNARTV